MTNKFNLSEETISMIKSAGEKIGTLQGEKAISARGGDKVKYTCYFLYHTKINKFTVAISDEYDEFSTDSDSYVPSFDTIDQAIDWWHITFDGMSCSDMYYGRGYNMAKRKLSTARDLQLDFPMMWNEEIENMLLDHNEDNDELDQDTIDSYYDYIDDQIYDDVIVVGRQARTEITF